MRIGGLGLFNRTSSSKRFNIASWHSPHSLTWRWILSIGQQPLWTVKPFVFGRRLQHGHGGLGFGLGQLLSFTAWRDNNGWQYHAALFWHALEFAQQPPMWYRDIYTRERDKELEKGFTTQRAPEPIIVHEHPTLQ